jgi:predicted metal-dependent HD superfamily phosphohydrolase
MSGPTLIVQKAERLVTSLYASRLPSWGKYHTLDHIREVVAACAEIGAGMKLGPEEMEAVVLAGWFHDAGYVDGAEDHEARSAGIAEGFLRSEGYAENRIGEILGCIRATKIPQRPTTLLEKVICDSDVGYIGGNAFRSHSDALRTEWELRAGVKFTEEEWLNKNIEFVERCRFHTSYAQERYGKKREANLRELMERLKEAGERG